MNYSQLQEITGWDCSPSGVRSIRAVSPFTLGEDGHHAAFYIAQPDDNTFYLTDAGESAMHASAFGIELSKAKIDALNKTHGVEYAKFEWNGAITASGHIADAQIALWDAAKLALSLTFNSKKWLPKLDHLRFQTKVEKVLLEQIGQTRFARNVKAQGMSGHQVEFPFAIQTIDKSKYFIEPFALSDGKIDWAHVYKVSGKLSDVKQADEQNHRLVIFEDGSSNLEFGRAATFLAQCASVRTLSQTKDWLSAA